MLHVKLDEYHVEDFQRKFVEETKVGAWIVEVKPVFQTTKSFHSVRSRDVVRAGGRTQFI